LVSLEAPSAFPLAANSKQQAESSRIGLNIQWWIDRFSVE